MGCCHGSSEDDACRESLGAAASVESAPSQMVSISKESKLVSDFILNHTRGSPVNLKPIQERYSTLAPDGATFIWDLNSMTTDFGGWDGNYDGLQDKSLDREDIGMVILKAIIEHGQAVNTVTTNGRTGLQISALAGDLEYCKELIEKGADVHAKDDDGETALSLCKRWHKNPNDLSNIIKYLKTF